jgi:carbohydrate kinase (thermoresistant glucokinase family)
MILVIMGAAGAGKTTVGRALAAAAGWRFYDADDWHAPEDRARMQRGEGLTDARRRPWLGRVRAVLERAAERNENAVLACSALKQRYRDVLTAGLPARFVFLTADADTLRARLEQRPGHFAGVSLLDSQLAALEPPAEALTLDATQRVPALVSQIRAAFGI